LLFNVEGRVGELRIQISGPSTTTAAFVLDDFRIVVPGRIGSATAEELPGDEKLLALRAANIRAMSGGVDAVRYYQETNGVVGLQVGSDKLLGEALSPADDWRLDVSSVGVKYGYDRMYAVAVDGTTTGPEAAIDLFLTPPATLAYHRPSEPLDVDGDRFITALDALVVINAINAGRMGNLAPPDSVSLYAFDTTGDDNLAPLDALIIINRLNAPPGSGGEGEGARGRDSEDSSGDESETFTYEKAANDVSGYALLAWLDETATGKKRRS
jgi:hypothetical protein